MRIDANNVHAWLTFIYCTVQAWTYTHIEVAYKPHIITQGRSQTSYTAPCNGVVIHGAQIGVFWFLKTTHLKETQSKSVHDLLALFLRSTFFSQRFTHVMGKTHRPPIWAPCRDKDGAGSEISLVYLWSKCMYLGLQSNGYPWYTCCPWQPMSAYCIFRP